MNIISSDFIGQKRLAKGIHDCRKRTPMFVFLGDENPIQI